MKMTEAQAAVALMAGAGLSNREIARMRGTTVKTVKNQLRDIYKQGVIVNRNELTHYCRTGETGVPLDGRSRTGQV